MTPTPEDTADGQEISDRTRMLVAAARQRAAEAPGALELADLFAAHRERRDLTEDDLRSLGRKAIDDARQVSYLLGKLAGFLGEPGGEPDAR